MKHGELFAGVGGFGIAANRAGFDTVWHVEIDKAAQSVLARHFPETKLLSDVCEVGKHNLNAVNVISFGSPCQDLSIAGKREGIFDGKRSSLFFEAIRICDELKPDIGIWENVPGALSSNSGRDFAAVLRAFRDIGARDIAWRILDAQYFGVPQRRRRVFIVADFTGERAAEILFEREGGTGDYPKIGEAGKDVAFTLRANSKKSLVSGDGVINETIIPFVMAHGQANAEIVRDGEPSLTRNHEAPILWEPRSQDGAPRIHNSGIVPTLNTAKGGQRQPMIGVRRLTPLECERLQGFPDNWTEGQSDSQRYKQMGNAVAVPVVEWIMRRVYAAISPSPTPDTRI